MFGLQDYMGMIGFSTYDNKTKQSIAMIFLSPIIFYITASILKDYFSEKRKDILKDQLEE